MNLKQTYYTKLESNSHAFVTAFQHDISVFEVRHDKKNDTFYLISNSATLPTIDSLAEIVKAAKSYVAKRHLSTINLDRSMYLHPELKYQPLRSLQGNKEAS